MKLSQYGKLIFIDLLGVFLATTSRTTWLDSTISSIDLPLEPTKLIFFIASIILTVGYLNYTLISHKNKLEKLKLVRDKDHKLLRESYLHLLEDELNTDFSDCNIRLFLPQNSMVSSATNLFRIEQKKKVILALVPIRGLCIDEIDKPLKFRVSPEEIAQGMVGETFSKDRICLQPSYGERVENEFTSRMDHAQNALSNEYEFIFTFPIITSSGKKVGIASIDSKTAKKIEIKSNDRLKNTMLKLGMDIHDSFVNLN
jgi:hypothetical protein